MKPKTRLLLVVMMMARLPSPVSAEPRTLYKPQDIDNARANVARHAWTRVIVTGWQQRVRFLVERAHPEDRSGKYAFRWASWPVDTSWIGLSRTNKANTPRSPSGLKHGGLSCSRRHRATLGRDLWRSSPVRILSPIYSGGARCMRF